MPLDAGIRNDKQEGYNTRRITKKRKQVKGGGDSGGNRSGTTVGHRVDLESKAMEAAWRHAVTRADVSTCQALLNFSPELLKSVWTETAVKREEEAVRFEFVEFLMESCRARGGGYQQMYNSLVRVAVRKAVTDYKSHPDMLHQLLGQGMDVNAGEVAFTEGSPLSDAISCNNPAAIQLMLQHGAYVHAYPGTLNSALSYALRMRRKEACKVLLSCERVKVSVVELCAAVGSGEVAMLDLVLQAEGNLITDSQGRGEWLAQALMLTVRNTVGYRYGQKIETDQIIKALLAPPAHWYPLPPDLLARGVREVLNIIKQQGIQHSLCSVVELLGKAGADLDVDGGALLRASAAPYLCNETWLEALVRGGADVRTHGARALRAAAHSGSNRYAARLLEAGVPVDSDPVLCQKLLGMALEQRPENMGVLLGSLDQTGVAPTGGSGTCSTARVCQAAASS
jgi:hypothetical protein